MDAPVTGDAFTVWYTMPHTLSESSRTFPTDHIHIIQTGAVAYALFTMETETANTVTIDPHATQEYDTIGRRTMARFNKMLYDLKEQAATIVPGALSWDTSNL